MHHPGKCDGLSDVLQSTDPRDSPLEAEAEARVHERPVAAKIEIPVVCIHRQPLFFDPPYESIVVVLSLGTGDELPVTFRGEAVVTHGSFIVKSQLLKSSLESE